MVSPRVREVREWEHLQQAPRLQHQRPRQRRKFARRGKQGCPKLVMRRHHSVPLWFILWQLHLLLWRPVILMFHMFLHLELVSMFMCALHVKVWITRMSVKLLPSGPKTTPVFVLGFKGMLLAWERGARGGTSDNLCGLTNEFLCPSTA